MRAVSSSLSDCNSSFDVSNSSFVDSVFFVDGQRFVVDPFLLFARNFKLPDSALELRSCGFEFLFKLGNSRDVFRNGRAISSALLLRLVNETNQQQLLAFARNRLYGNAERTWIAVVVHPPASDDNSRVLLARLLDCRPELGASVLTHHCEQIVRGMPVRHAHVTVCRSQQIKALVLAVDQDRRRRIGLHHQPSAKVGESSLVREQLALSRARVTCTPSPPHMEKPSSPWPAVTDVPIQPLLLGDYFEAIVGVA